MIGKLNKGKNTQIFIRTVGKIKGQFAGILIDHANFLEKALFLPAFSGVFHPKQIKTHKKPCVFNLKKP